MNWNDAIILLVGMVSLIIFAAHWAHEKIDARRIRKEQCREIYRQGLYWKRIKK